LVNPQKKKWVKSHASRKKKKKEMLNEERGWVAQHTGPDVTHPRGGGGKKGATRKPEPFVGKQNTSQKNDARENREQVVGGGKNSLRTEQTMGKKVHMVERQAKGGGDKCENTTQRTQGKLKKKTKASREGREQKGKKKF